MFRDIPIAIQCVPKRKEQVDRIIAELTEMGFTNVIPFYDENYEGMMFNFKRILEYNYGSSSHMLLIQDDIIFADNFADHLSNLIKLNHHCISLFAPPRKAYIEQLELGTRLYVEKNFLWNPAVLYRNDFRLGLIKYDYNENQLKEIANKHIDVMMGIYAKATKQYVLVTIPSIVQHDLSIPSTLGTAPKIGSIRRESSIFHKVDKNYFAQ